MTDLSSLLVLLVLGALVGLWMKLSVAREQAVGEARRQCEQHGLQLLDETVALRALRLCRAANGLRMIERCYGFEVSINGHDRDEGRLWMLGRTVSSLSLPAVETQLPVDPVKPPIVYLSNSNVVSFRPRAPDDSTK